MIISSTPKISSSPSSTTAVFVTVSFGSGARSTSVGSFSKSPSSFPSTVSVSPSERSETVECRSSLFPSPSASYITSPCTMAKFEINAAFEEELRMIYSTL